MRSVETQSAIVKLLPILHYSPGLRPSCYLCGTTVDQNRVGGCADQASEGAFGLRVFAISVTRAAAVSHRFRIRIGHGDSDDPCALRQAELRRLVVVIDAAY